MLNQKCKNEIRNAFQIIRIRINEKEKELIDKTESTLKDNLSELNTYIQVIQSKIITLNKIHESINSNLMRNDELNLINFYCDNKTNILSQIEINDNNSMPNNIKLNLMSDLKINIDKSSFDNMLLSLNNLSFEINNLKGIDVCNDFETGKYLAHRNLYGLEYKNRISSENPLNLNFLNTNKSFDNINQYFDKKNTKEKTPQRTNKPKNKNNKRIYSSKYRKNK